MKKLLSLLFVMVSFSCFAWDAKALQEIDREGLVQKLEAVTLYKGIHREFQSNLVANLSDGSRWKVHPKYDETFRNWHMGDYIHVQVRTSPYVKKREHLFELYNHVTQETIPVMLVDYPKYPETIDFIEFVKLAPNIKKIYMMDGCVWELQDSLKKLEKFHAFEDVYMAANYENGKIQYKMITGYELLADWANAYKSEGWYIYDDYYW